MSWEPLTLADVDLVAPPVEPSIGGLTYPGSRLLVSGEPESLKSWLAAVMAVERVRLGERVVWCDFEQGPAVTRSRFVDLGLADEELARVLYLAPREPLEAEARELLRRQLEEARPTVAVFDAYAGLLGVHDLDPDSSRDIERVNRLVVDVFRANGATVAILDHVVKAKDSRSRYSSGSGRKLAEVEVHLGLERVAHFKRAAPARPASATTRTASAGSRTRLSESSTSRATRPAAVSVAASAARRDPCGHRGGRRVPPDRLHGTRQRLPRAQAGARHPSRRRDRRDRQGRMGAAGTRRPHARAVRRRDTRRSRRQARRVREALPRGRRPRPGHRGRPRDELARRQRRNGP